MDWNKHVSEESKIVKRSEFMEATFCGYRVYVHRGEYTEISISPEPYDRLRLGLVKFHPKSVGDIEKFAADSEQFFKELVAALRAEGLNDLRSECDKREDERKISTAKFLADYQESHAAR